MMATAWAMRAIALPTSRAIGATNGVVDVGDLLAVITAWGACAGGGGGGGTCPPDIAPASPAAVGNGMIDVGDLLAVITAWGPCP